MAATATVKLEAKKAVFLAKILVATDFSPASDRALEYAVSLARRYGSTIYLTHIVTISGYPMMAAELAMEEEYKGRTAAVAAFRNVIDSGRLSDVKHHFVIEEGSLWPTLEALVKKYEVNMLILGTHAPKGVEKVLMGSAAEEIFRHARIPVMTIGPAASEEAMYEAEFKNILFATDFGPSAEREAAFAFSLAQEHRSRLTFLNVVPYADDYSEEAVTKKREAITKELKELVPVTDEKTCKVEFAMVIGEPVEEILRWARIAKADLIVMGAKRREGLAGHVLDSKAYKVICGVKCPVVTFRS
ncbi:MAG: universal stress protein [Candidatus Acidiferrales bacterium]